jgi:hypothetical protein
MSYARLTPERRRKNRAALLDVLGVAPERTVAEAMEDVLGLLSPRSPGFGDGSAPEVEPPTGPGAVGGTEASREERARRRRRGAAGDALLGRSTAGSKGDVDPINPLGGDHGSVSGVVESAPRRSGTLADAVAAGLITEDEAYEAHGHASGDRGGSGVREASAAQGRLSEQRRAAERLSASAERVCGCSDGADDAEDRKAGCGGVCRMAERHGRRFERATRGGLRQSEEVEGRRDRAGDLAA